ncbi:hypothetical protein [Paracoccus sp. SSJ]|uniref:hypothetical protein n=1 Tax=Paracoccus sp. SSJ TaxID=3050636 RepID=UPI00254B671A|nr:hypothetical protein [Paracoccus sp. SSJ]MDK8875418.1 hypothetical protein [Paracoccus sp. SSJ]
MKLFPNHAAFLVTISPLAACSLAVTITSRSTGQQGTGTLENTAFGNSGKANLTIGDEQYTGIWMAVRDTGVLGFSGDAGNGNAILRSNKGSHMTCQFRYSMKTYNALGTCTKDEKEIFDLQATLT